ncbi:MAG: hypothetical protein JSS10_06280 [Verrucomicrobia bacterium]|nr:hypothetical protein [Verrucomicrobiota bacterium]
MPEIEFDSDHTTAWQLVGDIAWDSAEWIGQIGGLKSLVISPLSLLARWAPIHFPGLGAPVNGARKLIGGAEAFSKFTKITSPDQNLSYVVVTDERKYQRKEVSYSSWAAITEASRVSDWLSSVCNLIHSFRPHPFVDWCKTLFSAVVALDSAAKASYFLYHLYTQSEKVAWQSIASSVMKVGLSILHMGLVAHRIAQLILPVVPAWTDDFELFAVMVVTVLSPIAHHYWDKFAVQPLYEKKKKPILS